MEACPRRACIALGWTPAAIRRLVRVWRVQWKGWSARPARGQVALPGPGHIVRVDGPAGLQAEHEVALGTGCASRASTVAGDGSMVRREWRGLERPFADGGAAALAEAAETAANMQHAPAQSRSDHPSVSSSPPRKPVVATK